MKTPCFARTIFVVMSLAPVWCLGAASGEEQPVTQIPDTSWGEAIFEGLREAVAARTDLEPEPTPWTPPLSGVNHPYLFPLYPDAHASYWAYTFERDESMANMAMEIKGQFPHCRYMSLSCYDPDTASVIDDMRDVRIEPDEGCVNPFRPLVDRADPNRSYTVYVVPEGSPWADCANTIVVPATATNTTLALRIYRPDEGCDIKGDVPLPEITAFNDLTGEVRPLPVRGREEQKAIAKRIVGVIRNVVADKDTLAAMETMVDPQISFFRWKGEGYLPNADNAYIVASLGYRPLDDVAMITFRPPSFPDTYSGGWIQGDEQIRYWSINLGGDIWTSTSSGICDDEAQVNADGTVSLVLGPEFLREEASAAGLNFLPWGPHAHRTLIYRHLCANDFEQSAGNVPVYDVNLPLDDQRAENHIGEYAPTGRYYSLSEFRRYLRSLNRRTVRR